MDKVLPSGITFATLSDAQSIRPDITPEVTKLHLVKRGDFITLLLKFRPPASKYIDKMGNVATYEPPANEISTEALTCLVSDVLQNGLIHCRVTASPAQTATHGVKYGDDFTISVPYVIRHDSTNSEQAKSVEHLLTDLAPIPPKTGQTYWTRDGAVATVWTELQSADGNYFIGEVSWPVGIGREGLRDVQWSKDGRNRQGQPGLDIVRDPASKMVEVA